MNTDLRDFLSDVIEKVILFKSVVSHIIVTRTPDGVMGMAIAKDGSINLTMESKLELPEIETVACFGSLPYLRNVLRYPTIQSGNSFTMDLAYGESKKKGVDALKTVVFKAKSLKVTYEATDPFLKHLGKAKAMKNEDWPVAFYIDEPFVDKFTDAVRIHSAAPDLKDEGRIFHLSYSRDDHDMVASFGKTTHQTSIVLSDSPELIDDTCTQVSAYFSIDDFATVGKMVAKEGGVACFFDKGLLITTENRVAKYNFAIVAKKVE